MVYTYNSDTYIPIKAACSLRPMTGRSSSSSSASLHIVVRVLQFIRYRTRLIQSLRFAIELTADPVLAKGPVDLTWLHRPFCAFAIKFCDQLLRHLEAGTEEESEAAPTESDLEEVRLEVGEAI